MKKVILSVALLSLILGFSNIAFAESKIAVINIPAVVAKSSQVQALKKEQQTKIQELEKWLKTAQDDINKQQTPEGKEKLAKKYQADFDKKKEAIAKNYQTKLQAADKSITQTIINESKKLGYDIVITKDVVLYGGVDITDQIKKAIK